MKQIIRLTESDLHKLIKESVKTILKEYVGEDGEFGRDIDDEYNSDHYSDDEYDGLSDDEIADAHGWSTAMNNDTPEYNAMVADDDMEERNQMAYDDAEREADFMDFNKPDPEPEY